MAVQQSLVPRFSLLHTKDLERELCFEKATCDSYSAKQTSRFYLLLGQIQPGLLTAVLVLPTALNCTHAVQGGILLAVQ